MAGIDCIWSSPLDLASYLTMASENNGRGGGSQGLSPSELLDGAQFRAENALCEALCRNNEPNNEFETFALVMQNLDGSSSIREHHDPANDWLCESQVVSVQRPDGIRVTYIYNKKTDKRTKKGGKKKKSPKFSTLPPK